MNLRAGMWVVAVMAAGAMFAASVADGIYTDDQAKQGGQDYQKECASCHGAELEGRGQAPPLAGDDFQLNWKGMTVGDLFDKIQSSMPADKPGQLSTDENAGILAYILQMNKFPSGKTALPGDVEALRKITFEAPK
jgi:mono/diheme cytochrome c family protein